MIKSGRTIITTPGHARPLLDESFPCRRVDIAAISAQSGIVAVGDEDVSEVTGNETGMPASADHIIVIESGDGRNSEDLSKIFIDCDTADQGVRWLAQY